MIKISDYAFNLPEELIAHKPANKRPQSRLLVYNRKTDTITHAKFENLPQFLPRNSLIVRNNSKVLPARLFGKSAKNNRKIELLLTEKANNSNKIWLTLVKPGKLCKPGDTIILPQNKATIVKILDDGRRELEAEKTIDINYLEAHGQLPLPPYIKTNYTKAVAERYQTTYAYKYGSIAAPTAGLHFTPTLDQELKKQFSITEVTLHVGLGTFAPLRAEQIKKKELHTEKYSLTKETVDLLNKQKQEDKPIIAVGTTSTRVLESQLSHFNRFQPGSFTTNIFITEDYKFKAINGLITNFHLPESSLFILISSFLGRSNAHKIYQEAIKEKYRFYSFGDACLFL